MHVNLHLPHPHRQQSGDAPANPLGLRARVWSHQFELDRDFAAGALPDRSPEHEARARQLLSDRCRRQLVAELDSALMKADHPPHWHSASLPVQTVSVQRARAELDALRRSLLACERPSLRGAALASCLLSDPQGPVYSASPGPTVAQLAQAAAGALTPADA